MSMSRTGFWTAFRSLGHTLAALTTNCPDFERAWNSAEQAESSGSALAGRWEGEWVSEANGHRGALRCVLSERGEGRYEARFHARYAKVLRVCYAIELGGTPSANGVRLKGHADLGRLAGGIYEYEGEVTANRLVCTYRCRYDHGTFRLARRVAVPQHPAHARAVHEH